MFSQRILNGASPGRKQQTAVKRTVDRPPTKIHSKDTIHYRNHPYQTASITSNHPIINDDTHWIKSSPKPFSDVLELNLTCQDEPLTETQLNTYPTQVMLFECLIEKIHLGFLGL